MVTLGGALGFSVFSSDLAADLSSGVLDDLSADLSAALSADLSGDLPLALELAAAASGDFSSLLSGSKGESKTFRRKTRYTLLVTGRWSADMSTPAAAKPVLVLAEK